MPPPSAFQGVYPIQEAAFPQKPVRIPDVSQRHYQNNYTEAIKKVLETQMESFLPKWCMVMGLKANLKSLLIGRYRISFGNILCSEKKVCKLRFELQKVEGNKNVDDICI